LTRQAIHYICAFSGLIELMPRKPVRSVFSATPVFTRATMRRAVRRARRSDRPSPPSGLAQHAKAGHIKRSARGLYATGPSTPIRDLVGWTASSSSRGWAGSRHRLPLRARAARFTLHRRVRVQPSRTGSRASSRRRNSLPASSARPPTLGPESVTTVDRFRRARRRNDA